MFWSSIVLAILVFIASAQADCGCSNRGYSGFVSPDENGLYEGDLRLNPSDVLAMSGFRNMITKWRRWPNGEIPYKITDWRHKMISWSIKSALNKLSKATGGCVRFRKATDNDKDYIKVVYKSGCWSYIGKQGGVQELSLGFGCELHRIVQHEFIHALGFGHEQSRPDRDNHITIYWDNIESKNCHNFRKWGQLPNHPYDIHSIMHYGHSDFTCKTFKWTMSTKNGKKVGGSGLTQLDIAKIKTLYECQ